MDSIHHNKRIFALGFFDGVHLGHQALLAECYRLAREQDCQTAAITFDPHPDKLLKGLAPKLINSVDDRHELLRSFGIGPIYTFAADKETLSMPWQEFLSLLMEYGAAGMVCGYDFRFGYRGQGDAEKVRAFCREQNIPCVVVPEQNLDGIRISSTHIRRLLEAGEMEEAIRFLGHAHYLSGTVVPGKHLGHKLGFPTANIVLPEDVLTPKLGVYACRAMVDGQMYPAVTNIGTRPTVGGEGITVEPWILGYAGNLYGKNIVLHFESFLRPEQKFASLEELTAQIQKDAEKTLEIFSIL